MPDISRTTKEDTAITVATSVSGSDVIAYGQYAGGRIYIPSGSSITAITWHDCETTDGTYLAAQDSSGTAVTQTVAASKSYPIPDALCGAQNLKATGDAAGTIGVVRKT